MINVYGYDKDNDIYDNITTIPNSAGYAETLNELVWCARLLTHHARSSSGDEYDWLCISKDARDPGEDMIMYYGTDEYFGDKVITLEGIGYKECFKNPEEIMDAEFDFIGW